MGSNDMVDEHLPPQRSMALYAAGGGFGGALLAIIVAKILSGPCCCWCEHSPPGEGRQKAAPVSFVTDVGSADNNG